MKKIIFVLVLVLVTTMAFGFNVNGQYFAYAYLYTGPYITRQPPFPRNASDKAVMVRTTIGGETKYIVYDNKYWYEYPWEEL